MPRASDVPCIRGFASRSLSEDRSLEVTYVSRHDTILHRATMLDSVCPEQEILTAILAGLLQSYLRGVVKNLKYVHGHCPESVKVW